MGVNKTGARRSRGRHLSNLVLVLPCCGDVKFLYHQLHMQNVTLNSSFVVILGPFLGSANVVCSPTKQPGCPDLLCLDMILDLLSKGVDVHIIPDPIDRLLISAAETFDVHNPLDPINTFVSGTSKQKEFICEKLTKVSGKLNAIFIEKLTEPIRIERTNRKSADLRHARTTIPVPFLHSPFEVSYKNENGTRSSQIIWPFAAQRYRGLHGTDIHSFMLEIFVQACKACTNPTDLFEKVQQRWNEQNIHQNEEYTAIIESLQILCDLEIVEKEQIHEMVQMLREDLPLSRFSSLMREVQQEVARKFPKIEGGVIEKKIKSMLLS